MAPTAEVLPVTAIVPTYNRFKPLREALMSLVMQSQAPAQILVVDDGSTDETPAIATAFGERVTYVRRQENQGKAAALNHGMTLAEHPYIWIFDDDDIADSAALERLHQALSTHRDCGFAYGLCDRFTGSWPAPTSAPYVSYSAPSRAILYIRLLEEFFIWQGAMLVRRRCYSEVGPFDASLLRSQDRDMTLRLARRFQGIDVPQILFHQRSHSGARGPGSLGERRTEVATTWKRFDQTILRKVHESHDILEFLHERPRGGAGPRELITALIQRASIMARAGIWDLASADMKAAAAQQKRLAAPSMLRSQELTALRRIFERYTRSSFGDAKEGRAFFAAVDQFEDRKMRNSIEAALLWQVLYRVKKLPWEDPLLTQAPELALILRCAGMRAVRHAFDRRKLRAASPITVISPSGRG
jgi:hypothetical protein